MDIYTFTKMKQRQQKITMLTCYDYTFAKLIAQTTMDCILVGDSVAMTMHGYEHTIPATVDMMALHVSAVKRGAPEKFIIADLPFLSHRKSLSSTMNAVQSLMQAGANAVKIEGVKGSEKTIQHIVESGVPVMGHLGLTPQSVHGLGGYRVQGKDNLVAEQLIHDALCLEKLGCFAVVLECVPALLAQNITEQLTIATIGIGAGPATDGQVLVLQDMLGLQTELQPKFLRKFSQGAEIVTQAFNDYIEQVKQNNFPNLETESY